MLRFQKIDKPLAFDLGAFDGKDTCFLRKHGYKVVSIEANYYRYLTNISTLSWIYDDVASENICISDQIGTVDFYLSTTPVWDSCNIDIACRRQKYIKKLNVKSTTVLELIKKYGIPEYIKCDIEGNDILMLRSLLHSEYRPKYISCECECQGKTYNIEKRYEVLDAMVSLGYKKFYLFDCRKNHVNNLTLLPSRIKSWKNYEQIKKELTELSEFYYTLRNKYHVWADIYCAF